MQKRRRAQMPPAFAPDRTRVRVDPAFWEDLQGKDLNLLCSRTLFNPVSDRQLNFHFLNEELRVDLENRCLKRRAQDGWEKTDDPLLELVTVIYLLSVKQIYPLGKEIIGTSDLKEAHFFQGPHALQVDSLLQRYGREITGFKEAAEYLKGAPQDMADAAYKLLPFPRVPLYYLLWKGDAEFKPRMNVLFDRSIEQVFSADAIWGLVNRVSRALLMGPAAKS